MCDGQAETGSAYAEEWRTARKEHRCCACRETIRAGDRYHHVWGVWDGEVDTFKHCARCWRIFQALVERMDGDPVDLMLDCGTKWEENFGELPADVAALAFMTREEAQIQTRPAATVSVASSADALPGSRQSQR